MFGFTTGCIKVKVLSFRRLFTCKIMRSNWASLQFSTPSFNIGNLVEYCGIRTSNQFVLTELNRMLEEQLLPQANGNLDTAVDGTSGEIEMEERRSTRVRQASVVRDREGDLNEKKLALQKSCAGHIGNLTKVHNEITRLMESDGSSEEVLRERMKFDEAWRQFVDAHESYLELLDSPTDALVLEKARTTYDERLKRKLDLDFDVRLWHKYKESERGEYNSMFSGETRGSRCSGVRGCQRCQERKKSWLWQN